MILGSTTSMEMHPNSIQCCCFRCIYIPKYTKLLQQAEAIGALVLICVVFRKGSM